MASSQVKEKHRLYSPMDNMSVEAETLAEPGSPTPSARLNAAGIIGWVGRVSGSGAAHLIRWADQK